MSKLTQNIEVQLWVSATSTYSTTWTDITADVITDTVDCFSGTRGTTILDRVSGVGYLKFDLNNSASNSAKLAGYYSPGHTNARVGFDMGCPIRLRYTFEGVTRTKWYGRIYIYLPEPGTMLTRRTHITAYDWMYQANKYTVRLPSYEVNKRMDEAMPLVINDVPVQPLSTDFSVCPDTFPTVFDNMDYRTTATAEFQKLAQSEIGNVFIKHNLAHDEILTSTNKLSRNAAPSSEYTLPDSSASALLDEDGSIILDEDGSYLLSDDTYMIEFIDTQMELAYSYGSQMYNDVTVTTYPRVVSSTLGVLFS